METHVITKEDLLEMLKRFDDKAKIAVQAGDQPLYIDSVDYSCGQINIKCHNDIEDERADLEDEIGGLKRGFESLERKISDLSEYCNDESRTREEIVAQIEKLAETANV